MGSPRKKVLHTQLLTIPRLVKEPYRIAHGYEQTQDKAQGNDPMESMEGGRFFPVVEDAYFRFVAYMYKIM